MKTKTLNQLMRHKTKNLIRQKAHHLEILIYPHNQGYSIEYDRMDTHEKVLGWVKHLCDKVNVTTEHIRQFVDFALRVIGESQKSTPAKKSAQWTKKAALEFRKLALAEVKGKITNAELARLDELGAARDRHYVANGKGDL